MADPIIRLRVESQEYDSKLKRATDGLLAFEQSCHKAQKSMADADKATIDYVREMGKMETVNKTAKGSISELTKSFVELSAQYNRLTDEEKKSPFGQALAKSIDELKQRVQQGRRELDDINRSLNTTQQSGKSTGGVLDSLAQKFGLNSTQLVSFASKLGLAKVALDVAKDAFFASEANIDEWGRVVRSAQDVYQGFLTALNTSDISGFLTRIDTIIKAARDAYDALDALDTAKTINSPRKSAQQAEIERMRQMLATGTYIAPHGQKPAMPEGTKLTEQQMKNIADHLVRAEKTLVTIVKEEVGYADKAIDALYREQATRLGMSEKQFRQGTSSMTEFKNMLDMADAYQKFETEHTRYVNTGGGSASTYAAFGGTYRQRDAARNPYESYKGWKVFKDDGDLFKQIVSLVGQRDQSLSTMYSGLGSSYRRVNRVAGYTPYRGGGGGGSTGGGGGGTTDVPVIPKTEQQLNSEKIRELNQEYVTATEQRKAVIRSEIKILQIRNDEIQRLIDESNGKIAEDTSSFNLKNIQAWIGGIKKKLNEAELGTEVYDRLTAQLSDATALSNLLGAFINNGLSMTDIDAKPIWEKILSGKDIPAEELQTILDSLNTKLAELHLAPLKLDIEGNVSTDTSLFSQKNIQDLISTTKQQLEQSQIGSDFYNALTAKLYDATALSSLLGEFVKNGIDFAEVDPSAMWSKIFGGEDVATEELQKMLDTLNAYLAEHGLDLMKFNADGSLSNVESKKGGNKFDEGLDKVSKAMSGLSTIMSGLQQTGVKIPSGIQDAVGVMQGVISVVQGVQAVISLFSSTTETANTAALIANTAAVGTLTTVMAANTAMSFMPFLRFGGIAHAATGLVAGHDFSDNVPVMVSSGELILNRAQQGNLAQQLEGGGGFDNLHLETSVRAEEFRIMLNSNSMRRGRGEYVTTKRQR